MGTKSRIAWPDAARGIAITLVVLHHGVQYAAEANLIWPGWLAATEFLRTMRMPLFFLAAGLFAGKWVEGDWIPLLRSKVLLLLWVFAIWVVIRWSAFNLIPQQNAESGWLNLLKHLVWPLGGWFLVTLAAFFILARATKRLDPRIQIATAALASAAWFSGLVAIGNHAFDGIFFFYVFFLIGCHLRGPILERTQALSWYWCVALVVLWCGTYFGLYLAGLEHSKLFAFPLRLLGALAGIAIAILLQHIGWLRRLGQKTLPIYVAHSIIIYLLVSAAVAAGIDAWELAPVVSPVLLAGIALALSFALGEVAPKIGLKWLFESPRWLERLFDRAMTRRGGAGTSTTELQ